MRHIPNDQLVLDSIPVSDADWEAVQAFALTFDGYSAHGSFDRCAEIANARQHNSLTDLRTCLFFEQRRWRHFGEHPDDDAMDYVRGLVNQIRAKLAKKELD